MVKESTHATANYYCLFNFKSKIKDRPLGPFPINQLTGNIFSQKHSPSRERKRSNYNLRIPDSHMRVEQTVLEHDKQTEQINKTTP